ncbi:MAG: molybdenum cofactor cytidylyltransferase [Paracoccaceae bacterium]|jgi:molybdenum cofactor cytidylyltransferase
MASNLTIAKSAGKSVGIIILAAGRASRMNGVDKLLEQIDGVHLITRVGRVCLASGAEQITAVLRANDAKRRSALPVGIEVIANPDASEGMATSLAVGVRALAQTCQAAIVVLADMPDVTSRDIDALIAAFDPKNGTSICQAITPAGELGHPVLFGREHFDELSNLTGDNGARKIIAAHPDAIRYVETEGEGARTDLDTPQDWVTYRNR